jgi:hypothetical protein
MTITSYRIDYNTGDEKSVEFSIKAYIVLVVLSDLPCSL